MVKSSLENTLRAAPVAVAIALDGCGGGGSGGGSTPVAPPVDPVLTKAEAVAVAAGVLGSNAGSGTVRVGFSPLSEVACDNIGTYSIAGENKRVCQVVGTEGVEGVPNFSPDDVGLVSRIPLGTSSQVLSDAQADLSGAQWGPVMVSEGTVELGQYNMGSPVSGVLNVRGSGNVSGSCDMYDATSKLVGANTLNFKGASDGVSSLEIASSNGFSQPEGSYTFDCTFSDSLGTRTIKNAARVDIMYYNAKPVISGVVSPLEVIVGENTALGGSCTDEESGNLALTPERYTAANLGSVTLERSCTDGTQVSTVPQVITPKCASGLVASGSSCVVPVTYDWSVGDWGACSVSCGGGVQYRDVDCVGSDGSVVSGSYCPSSAPASAQSCNTQSCGGGDGGFD